MLKKIRCAENEYKIQKLLHKNFPSIVPRPVSWSRGVMTTEYTEGVRTCNQGQVAKQVCAHLKTIKRKFPNFRHNNMTLTNVLLTKKGPMIIGFGRASFKGGPDRDEVFFMNEFSGKPPKRCTVNRSALLDFIKNSGITVIHSGKK